MNAIASQPIVSNPYISIEVKAESLGKFCKSLADSIECEGVRCEQSAGLHVSIAYARGSASVRDVEEVACEIANEGFTCRARQFEILEGHTTPYDYLVLSLETRGDFETAVGIVEQSLETQKFQGGFKSHVSLLKFEKGTAQSEWAQELVRELNASQGAAFALGRAMCVEGECVCVYDQDRQSVCKVACQAAARQMVA